LEKEKKFFCEICAKKLRTKMDQQQNGQSQKGPQQNELRKSGRPKQTCFLENCPIWTIVQKIQSFQKYFSDFGLYIYSHAVSDAFLLAGECFSNKHPGSEIV